MRSQRVSACMTDLERSWVLRKWQQAPIPLSFSHPTVFKSIPLDAFRPANKPNGHGHDSRTSCFGTIILNQCCLTHRKQFSMVCNLIDHRNKVKMFKTQVEPRVAREWFYFKVLNILTSFLWLIWVQTMENCCRFFYNNINSFCRPLPLTFHGK